MQLKNMPSETKITPHILDFLERSLEPLPFPIHHTQSKQIEEIVSDAAVSPPQVLNITVDVDIFYSIGPGAAAAAAVGRAILRRRRLIPANTIAVVFVQIDGESHGRRLFAKITGITINCY